MSRQIKRDHVEEPFKRRCDALPDRARRSHAVNKYEWSTASGAGHREDHNLILGEARENQSPTFISTAPVMRSNSAKVVG